MLLLLRRLLHRRYRNRQYPTRLRKLEQSNKSGIDIATAGTGTAGIGTDISAIAAAFATATSIGAMATRTAMDTGIHDATGAEWRRRNAETMMMPGLPRSPAFLLPWTFPGRYLCTHSPFPSTAGALP